jgi:hypothetical protein
MWSGSLQTVDWLTLIWCPEGDLNPHDLIRVCGF